MKLSQYIVLGIAGLFVFANLLYPGGWVLTLAILVLLFIALAAYEFFPEYILVTNQGKNARKSDKRRSRRASGLNPFSRTSKRDDSRQSSAQTQNGGNDD